jgi:hypothetical protein
MGHSELLERQDNCAGKIDDGEGLAMRSGKEEGLLRPDRGVCRIIPALLFLAAICILPLRAA